MNQHFAPWLSQKKTTTTKNNNNAACNPSIRPLLLVNTLKSSTQTFVPYRLLRCLYPTSAHDGISRAMISMTLLSMNPVLASLLVICLWLFVFGYLSLVICLWLFVFVSSVHFRPM